MGSIHVGPTKIQGNLPAPLRPYSTRADVRFMRMADVAQLDVVDYKVAYVEATVSDDSFANCSIRLGDVAFEKWRASIFTMDHVALGRSGYTKCGGVAIIHKDTTPYPPVNGFVSSFSSSSHPKDASPR